MYVNLFLQKWIVHQKWRSKLGSLEMLIDYINRVENLDRDLLSASLPELVNVLSQLLHDTKAEVADTATTALKLAMKGITNRDLEPFVDNLVLAILDRNETEETIQKLAGIVFVQTVEGSALSVVVPLMVAGFKQNKGIIKRMCSRIVSNITKLVEEPIEAAPFLSELIPSLEYAIDTIPDPEARDVATKTLAELKNIREKAAIASEKLKFRKTENVRSFISENDSSLDAEVVNYLAAITTSLIKTKTTECDEYNDELTPFTSNTDLIQKLYENAQSVIGLNDEETEDDADEGELLCDCEFTLAYGTKILYTIQK